jgi:hypothetical protein
VITEWSVLPEPQIQPFFTNVCYATDIQIQEATEGIVMVTPDNTSLYRVFLDFDGAIDKEFVGPYSGSPPPLSPPLTPPFPVFGVVDGDLMILKAGAGIIFPGGSVNAFPRVLYRMRLDNDGTPGSEPVTTGYWMQIPENNVAQNVDAFSNWVFTQDVQMVQPGIGIVMPLRGGVGTRRLRIDFDGALLSE